MMLNDMMLISISNIWMIDQQNRLFIINGEQYHQLETNINIGQKSEQLIDRN